MQNFQQKVPAQAWPAVKALLVDRRDAPSREKAEQRREAIGEKDEREFPELGRCLLDDAEASLNPLEVPHRPQQYVRTSNVVERAFVEERRRTKVLPPLWTEGSFVHLVFGVLLRVRDRWSKKCFREFEQHQIRSLRARLQLDEQEVSMNELSGHVPTRRSAASAASSSLQKLVDLTGSAFVERMRHAVEEREPPALHRRSESPLTRVVEQVRQAVGVSAEELAGRGRRGAVSRARAGVAYLWIECLGHSAPLAASGLELRSQTISEASRRDQQEAAYWQNLLSAPGQQ